MKLTEHFTLDELTKTQVRHLLGLNRLEGAKHVERLTEVCTKLLEPIRLHYSLPVVVNSGYRCKELNEAIGGSPFSQHCQGEAADFDVMTMNTEEGRKEVMHWIWKESGILFRQLILEYGCIHISLPHGDGKDFQVFELDMGTWEKKWWSTPV